MTAGHRQPLMADGEVRHRNWHYDVIVVGGGMAGCIAAVAAARRGAHVLVVEQNAFLGGAATAGGVGQFVGWRTRAGRQVVGGLAQELVERLLADGACGEIDEFVMSTGHRMNRIQYDPELLKIALDQMLVEAGVEVIFRSVLIDCEVNAGRVTGLALWAAGQCITASAQTYIDCSGDMTLLARAGAEFLCLEDGESLQPATLMFAVAPVDFPVLDTLAPDRKRDIAARGVASGVLPRAALHYSRAPGSDAAWFNVSRVALDPGDPVSISRAEIEGRRQALEISKFIRANLPGCEESRLTTLAPQLGVRDTRRVRGDHVITTQDIATGRAFPDTVACGAYPIDIHLAGSPDLRLVEFGDDHHYTIPYRSLIPAGLVNVLAAGRGISANHEAFAALRVMPTAMAMGHAAGVAGAIAATQAQGTVRAVDVAELRGTLAAQGAFLGQT